MLLDFKLGLAEQDYCYYLCGDDKVQQARACEICQFSESKRIKYEQDMYDEKRLRGEMKGERQKGREEGLAQGLAEGLAKGLAQSEERLREAAINYAKKLKATDMSVETIAEILELPIEEIKAL